VASEASATPLRNYAPQSNFSASRRLDRVGLTFDQTFDETFDQTLDPAMDITLVPALEPALDSTNTDAIQP
jgi:hypothetical protein